MRRTNSRSTRRTAGVGGLVVAVALTIAGCGGDAPPEPVAEAPAEPAGDASSGDAADAPDYGVVTPDQAVELAASGVTVIDVRTPEEYAEGHIEGAQLIDFYSDTFAEQIASLDPDDEYLVYCRSGNRSGQTTALMQQNGIDQVWDLQGGVLAGDLPLVP